MEKKYVQIYLADWYFKTIDGQYLVARKVVTPYINPDHISKVDYHMGCALREFGEHAKNLTNTFIRDENNRIKVDSIIFRKYISESFLTEEEFLRQFPEDRPIPAKQKGGRDTNKPQGTDERPPSEGLFERAYDGGEHAAEDLPPWDEPNQSIGTVQTSGQTNAPGPDIRTITAPTQDNAVAVGAGTADASFDWNSF